MSDERIKFTYETDDGAEIEAAIPAKYEVCPLCQGRGKHVNPNIDSHGITPEEFAEDPDFKEDYFKGVYDVVCEECDGLRVVLVPNDKTADQELLKLYYDKLRAEAYYQYERAQERKMGY